MKAIHLENSTLFDCTRSSKKCLISNDTEEVIFTKIDSRAGTFMIQLDNPPKCFKCQQGTLSACNEKVSYFNGQSSLDRDRVL